MDAATVKSPVQCWAFSQFLKGDITEGMNVYWGLSSRKPRFVYPNKNQRSHLTPDVWMRGSLRAFTFLNHYSTSIVCSCKPKIFLQPTLYTITHFQRLKNNWRNQTNQPTNLEMLCLAVCVARFSCYLFVGFFLFFTLITLLVSLSTSSIICQKQIKKTL